MISKQELLQLRTEWQLDIGVIEKDYVLGWVLAAIAAEPALAEHWIFKGGTCLRKCYYETYRFSEDLDFTVIDGGPEDPDVRDPIKEIPRFRTFISIVRPKGAFESLFARAFQHKVCQLTSRKSRTLDVLPRLCHARERICRTEARSFGPTTDGELAQIQMPLAYWRIRALPCISGEPPRGSRRATR
ncbi:MAG TPA: nucleotidyl transferase AbiEii/AbiGii toxin family protein [Solirubrobacteraceae bacterium]